MATAIVPQPSTRKVIEPIWYFVGKRRKLDGYRAFVDGQFIGNFATFVAAEDAADALILDLARP